LILLEFQNLWNLINLFIKIFYGKLIKIFPMIFQSLIGLGKSRFDVPSGPLKDAFAQQHLLLKNI